LNLANFHMNFFAQCQSKSGLSPRRRLNAEALTKVPSLFQRTCDVALYPQANKSRDQGWFGRNAQLHCCEYWTFPVDSGNLFQ
jgi:hypothetical protein